MEHALRIASLTLATVWFAGCSTATPAAPAANPQAAAECVPVTGSRICRKERNGITRVDTGSADSLKGNSIVTLPR